MESWDLVARHEPGDDGAIRVLAPAVGWWSDPPANGALVSPASPIGSMTCLNRRGRLILPDEVAGRVDGAPRDRVLAVDYGRMLFAVVPVEAGRGRSEAATSTNRPGAALPPGHRAIVAPTDGVFYRRPSPDAPAFVEVGTKVHLGQAVGLVEVMKTFNQILYDGAGLPAQGEVVEIRCADGDEVASGEILIVVR